MGAGGLVAARLTGFAGDARLPMRYAPVAGRGGQVSRGQAPKLGGGSDAVADASAKSTKKRPGMMLVACLARSLRA